jgi:hypothetical protein
MMEIHMSSTMKEIVEEVAQLPANLPERLTSQLSSGILKIGPCVFLASTLDDAIRGVMQHSPPNDPSRYEYTINKIHIEDEVDSDLFAVAYWYARSLATLVEQNSGLSIDVMLTCHSTIDFGLQSIVTFYQIGQSPMIDVENLDDFPEAIMIFRIRDGLNNSSPKSANRM